MVLDRVKHTFVSGAKLLVWADADQEGISVCCRERV